LSGLLVELPEQLTVAGHVYAKNERGCYTVKDWTSEGEHFKVEVLLMLVNVRVVVTWCDPDRDPTRWTYEQGYCYPASRIVSAFAAAYEWQPFVNEPVGHVKRAL
jgi:hypothetical protein